jgi:Uma2 family endonuclease
MVVQTLIRQKSIEEYLAAEETAEQRSEYRNGEIIAMAGGSINHNRIIRNFSRLLGSPSNSNYGNLTTVNLSCYP